MTIGVWSTAAGRHEAEAVAESSHLVHKQEAGREGTRKCPAMGLELIDIYCK